MQLNAEIQMSTLQIENAVFLFIYRKVTVLPIFSPRQKGAADLETPLCWAQIYILTGKLGTPSVLCHFNWFSLKIILTRFPEKW